MKTVKDVAAIAGVSIRTLRYYDEIGLLKPTQITASGYRLYDDRAIEKLQEIMFFRELEIPLQDIREIMQNPDYDREQALLTQKKLLEQKRSRLDGLIGLIADVMKGVNTMSFEAFNREEIEKVVEHTMQSMSKESLAREISRAGSEAQYRGQLAAGFANEQAMAELFKWYGSKEKALAAMLQENGSAEEVRQEQEENERIYRRFAEAKRTEDAELAGAAVESLAENYKQLFLLDNARNMLLDLAKEYLTHGKLAEQTDARYGEGCSEYIAKAINAYYGV